MAAKKVEFADVTAKLAERDQTCKQKKQELNDLLAATKSEVCTFISLSSLVFTRYLDLALLIMLLIMGFRCKGDMLSKLYNKTRERFFYRFPGLTLLSKEIL